MIKGAGCGFNMNLPHREIAKVSPGACSTDLVFVVASVDFKQPSFCLGNSSEFVNPLTKAVFREILCKGQNGQTVSS